MPTDPLELTRRLVAIASPTYHEAAVGEFLDETLRASGWAVERMPVERPAPGTPGAEGGGDRFNLFATVGSNRQTAGSNRQTVGPNRHAEIVFSTHMDTVPPHVELAEDATYLYGRGACDAKGIIAAQIAAAECLRDEGVAVGLLFVVGEERDSAGAKVANQQPRGARFLINGEPTDNCLALASKGCLRVELYAAGTMAHSAYPELGESATAKLVGALADVLALDLPIVEGIGDTTLNVGLLSGGRAPNVIADRAEAHLLVRLVGPSDEIRAAIVRAVAGRARVEFPLEMPLVRMRAVGALPTMIAKFTTDIPSLTGWGEPFLLGPGSIHVAHTPGERIGKAELLAAVPLYVELARTLLAEPRAEFPHAG